MKLDLHVHSSERSPCAVCGEEEMIRAAIARGLDALAFTDHGTFVPQARLDALNRAYAPFRIFGGIEITLQEREDVLVLGIHDPALESRKWTYPELHALVRDQGGWIALAHPFRYHVDILMDIAHYPPNALESCSSNIVLSNQPRIRELARQLGLHMVCNSDAHATRSLGVGHNLLKKTPVDEADLVQMLRAGDYTTVCTITDRDTD